MSKSLEEDSGPEKKIELKDFEKALQRLEAIVERLEGGELTLEESVSLFEEGMKISRFCGDRLEEAERKVEILLRNSRGEMTEEPFQVGTDDQTEE